MHTKIFITVYTAPFLAPKDAYYTTFTITYTVSMHPKIHTTQSLPSPIQFLSLQPQIHTTIFTIICTIPYYKLTWLRWLNEDLENTGTMLDEWWNMMYNFHLRSRHKKQVSQQTPLLYGTYQSLPLHWAEAAQIFPCKSLSASWLVLVSYY